MKPKFKTGTVTTIRTFDSTTAKRFIVDGKPMSRKEVERMEYGQLKRLLTRGKVLTVRPV